MQQIKYFSDFKNDASVFCFTDRQWQRMDNNQEADFVWVSTEAFPKFLIDSFNRLSKFKIYVNHVPNSFELTRKDLLSRNLLTLYQKGKKHFPLILPDYLFCPQTYILPVDQQRYISQETASERYIVKPCGYQQGKGIFVSNKAGILEWLKTDYQQILKEAVDENSNNNITFHQIYIIQKYVNNPLLINLRKFDLRIYVLLESNRISINKLGFGRFCSSDYKNDNNEKEANLTNASINHIKIDTRKIFQLLLNQHSKNSLKKLSYQIVKIIILIVLSTLFQLNFKSNCFELFGFDVLITEQLKPIIMEVNSSPSLQCDNIQDMALKKTVVHDSIDSLYQQNNVYKNSSFITIFEFQKQQDLNEKFGEYYSKGKRNECIWSQWAFM